MTNRALRGVALGILLVAITTPVAGASAQSDQPAPAQLEVTPNDELLPGDTVTVRVSEFADSPGADYATDRVVLGLASALGLTLMAGWLVRSTNWSPPSESNSTLLDEADYADLDLEAAQFEEFSMTASPEASPN